MCGFVGVIGKNPSARTIRTMLAAIPHTGEHDFFHLRGETFHIACSRSPQGSPASFYKEPDGALALFGEVYNLDELDARLSAQDPCGEKDLARVLFDYYREFGAQRLRDIDGAWAVAVIDDRERKCFLTADSFGITHLFYSILHRGNTLLFSSHANALFLYPNFSTEIDAVTLLEKKVLGLHDGERTYFKDVKQVPLNCGLEIPFDNVSAIGRHRNSNSLETESERKLSVKDWLTRCEQALVHAVGKRSARCDHQPRGLALSGGIDSSLLATLMQREDTAELICYTLFDSEEVEDLTYAQLLVDALNLHHQPCRVSSKEFFESLPNLIWVIGSHGPIFSPYFIAQKIRNSNPGIPLFFCGEGAEDYLGKNTLFFQLILKKTEQQLVGLGPAEIGESKLLSRIAPWLAGRKRQPDCSDEFLELIEPYEMGNFYTIRAASDAFGLECALPFADREVAALARLMPRKLRTEDKILNFVARLLLTKTLSDRDLCDKLLARRKEPAFYALWRNINSFMQSINQRMLPSFFEKNKYRRYARHAIDVFWPWSLEVVFLKYKGRVAGMTFDDLVDEITSEYKKRDT